MLESAIRNVLNWLLYSKAGAMVVVVLLPTLSLPLPRPWSAACDNEDYAINLIKYPDILTIKILEHRS
jgi:hypothetical protein